jgi:hypothetical protein
MTKNGKEVYTVVTKWRGMDRHQLWIWAHLRLDRIEEKLGLDNKTPNLEEITQKLDDEATEKKTYPTETEASIFHQLFSKCWVKSNIGFRHFLNRIFCPNQGKRQNKSADKCDD